MTSEKPNWALQQKAYVEECIETFLDFKQYLKKKEGEEIELIKYQNDQSRKVLQDLPLPALNSSLDLEHFTEILHSKYKTVHQKNAPHLLISLKTYIINSVKI